MKNVLLDKGIILPSGEISKDKVNLVAGAITQSFAEMVWVTTGGDMETVNRLTDVLVTMNTPADRGKLFKIIKMLYVAGDDVDERKGQHSRKGTACTLLCPAAADGYGEQDVQVVDDGPADVLHRSADGHDGGNVAAAHLHQLAQTDHQTRRRHDGDDGHQNLAQFLQKVEIDEPFLLGSCLCGCHDIPPCFFAFDYASVALHVH